MFLLSSLGSLHYLVCAILVRRVIEESPNVMNEQGVQQLCNLFLVGEI